MSGGEPGHGLKFCKDCNGLKNYRVYHGVNGDNLYCVMGHYIGTEPRTNKPPF